MGHVLTYIWNAHIYNGTDLTHTHTCTCTHTYTHAHTQHTHTCTHPLPENGSLVCEHNTSPAATEAGRPRTITLSSKSHRVLKGGKNVWNEMYLIPSIQGNKFRELPASG